MFSPEAPSPSLVETASTTGQPTRNRLLAASVTGVSDRPAASRASVAPVQGRSPVPAPFCGAQRLHACRCPVRGGGGLPAAPASNFPCQSGCPAGGKTHHRQQLPALRRQGAGRLQRCFQCTEAAAYRKCDRSSVLCDHRVLPPAPAAWSAPCAPPLARRLRRAGGRQAEGMDGRVPAAARRQSRCRRA